MAYGPSGGWFGPNLASFGGSTSWWDPIPAFSIPNPAAQILLLQCNGSLVREAGNASLVGSWPGAGAPEQPQLGDAGSGAITAVAGECLGDAVAQRISLGTGLYFLVMAAVAAASAQWHRGMWFWKVLLHVAFVVTAFFLPADAGEPWGHTTMGISAVFLLAQVFMMVDLAFSLHDCLAARIVRRAEELRDEYQGAENEPGCMSNVWAWAYALLAVGLWLGSASVVITLAVQEVGKGPECAGGTGAMAASLLLAIVYTVASLLDCLAPASGAKGALPPAVVFAYCTWLLVSALGSLDSRCAALPSVEDPGSFVSVLLSVVVAAVSLGYTAYSAAATVPGLFGTGTARAGEADGSDSHEAAALLEGEGAAATRERDLDHEDEEAEGHGVVEDGGRGGGAAAKARSTYVADDDDDEEEEEEDEEDRRDGGRHSCCDGDPRSFTWAFHLVMMTAAVYMGAALTGWQVPSTGQFIVTNITSSNPLVHSQESPGAFWAQTLAGVAAVALYGWCLVAELCCPGRTFGPV